MVKPRTFITDEQRLREQRRQLMDMAENSESAKTLIEKLDANPELQQGLWDVYCRAWWRGRDSGKFPSAL